MIPMAEKTLLNIVTDNGRLRPYSMPGSSELDGAEVMPDGALAVKCEEGKYLIFSERHAFFYEQTSDGGVLADTDRLCSASSAMPEEFLDWETEFSAAPGLILTACFKENAVAIDGTLFSLKVLPTGERQYLLLFETGETVFFDAKRFLWYSAANGRVVTGYVEVPPRRDEK